MIYLASPYSHPDPAIRDQRFRAVCRKAAELIEDGQVVFSPIAHTHPIAIYGNLRFDWDTWKPVDQMFLAVCDELVVLMLDGWVMSNGVLAEIDIAKNLGKPVRFLGMTEPVKFLKAKP